MQDKEIEEKIRKCALEMSRVVLDKYEPAIVAAACGAIIEIARREYGIDTDKMMQFMKSSKFLKEKIQ